jgi:hypothetical protein
MDRIWLAGSKLHNRHIMSRRRQGRKIALFTPRLNSPNLSTGQTVAKRFHYYDEELHEKETGNG